MYIDCMLFGLFCMYVHGPMYATYFRPYFDFYSFSINSMYLWSEYFFIRISGIDGKNNEQIMWITMKIRHHSPSVMPTWSSNIEQNIFN